MGLEPCTGEACKCARQQSEINGLHMEVAQPRALEAVWALQAVCVLRQPVISSEAGQGRQAQWNGCADIQCLQLGTLLLHKGPILSQVLAQGPQPCQQ